MNVRESMISAADRGLLQRIDELVLASERGYAYQRPQWAQAIRKAYGFDSSVLTAWDGARLAASLIVTHHRGLSGRRALCALPYCDFGGAVATDERAEQRVIQTAASLLGRTGVPRIEMRVLRPSAPTPAAGAKASLQFNLPDSREALLSGYKAKLRSQIRKAGKNGLTFRYGRGGSFIDDFYAVYAHNMRDLGSPPHARAWYDALDACFNDDLLIGLVDSGQRCIGAGLLLFSGDRVSIPWASTLRDYNRLAPNMLLYAELLNQAVDRGCVVFDFGRSDFDGGTYRFKRQWGATPVALDWLELQTGRDTWRSQPTAGAGGARARLARLWSSLPVPVSTLLGSRLRRYLSL